MATLQKSRMVSHQLPIENGKTVSVAAMSSDGTALPTPLMSYYLKMPRDSACLISVNNTGKAPRFYSDPLSIPKRDIECWNQARVEKELRMIRTQHPALAETVTIPASWEDLYRYYDAHDLWLQGAWNLWTVINELGYQNEKLVCYHQQMQKIQNLGHRSPLKPAEMSLISDFAEGWISFTENRLMLIKWDGSHDILQLLSPVDWKEGGVEGLNQTQANFLRDEFTYWHRYWRERYDNPARFFPPDQWHHLGGKYAKKDSVSGPKKRFVTPYSKPLTTPNDALQPPAATIPPPAQPSVKHGDSVPEHKVPTDASSHPKAITRPVPHSRPMPAPRSVPISVPTGHPVVVNGSLQAQNSKIAENDATTEETAKPINSTKPGSPTPCVGETDAPIACTEASGSSHIPDHPSEETVGKQGQQQVAVDPEIPQRGYHPKNKARKNSHKPVPPPKPIPVSNRIHAKCYNRDKMDKSPCKPWNKMAAGHFVACPCGRCSALSRTALVKQIGHVPGMSQSEKIARLEGYFSRYGVIQQCEIKTTSGTGTCYALIRYSLENSAVAAVASADGAPLSPLSTSMRLEHPWYSKYWAPKPYNKTPSEATHTTPPSGRQPHSDQGFLGRETAQQQHAAPVPLGSPHGISNVGRPSTSPEYLRGPPPGFPSPVCQPQAGWQPSPPRMQPQPMGVNGIDLGYHGPPHQQPSVPFHHQMAQIPQQPQTYGGLPPAHQFNQGFQPYGPPQWHHGPPPHWHYPHPHPPPPPPPPPPPGLYGPIDFADPIPQPPYQVPPPFNHHGGPYGHAQPHVNPQVQGPRVTNGGYLEQGPPKTESLPHSSSSSGEESARILFELLRGKARAVQATTTEGFNKASSGESASPDKPSTPSDNASTLEGQHVVDASEKSSQEGERSYQGGTVVRHAQFSIQDVRFDQNMSGTVRIRPNRRNQHQALPTEWLSGSGLNISSVEQATQTGPSKKEAGNRCATPVEQAAPSGPKKGKNKKKAGTRSSSRPSTPVNFCPNQPESSKATASVPTEQTESVNEKAALQVPGPKGYRADAGGSLKMSRNRKGPAIRVSQLTEQMLPPPLSNGSLEAGPSAGPVANGINTKQARFQRFDSLSSMPDCPVLPRASDLFPNYPDLSTSPPKIVMTPAEITPVEEAISLSEANLTNGLDGGTHRVSDSSRCQSFYTAKSTLSSRENSPPEAAKDEVFVSPPETPTKQQTASQVSSRTLSAHPSPVAAPAAPVSDSPIATPTLDTDNNNDMSQPEPAEPAVPNFETPPPEPSRPKSKKKNKKKNKAKANIAADPSSATDPSSSQPPEKQQQQQPTPIISNPNSRPATPASDGSSANIRNQKKRKAHARTKAEKKRSAATATTTTTTSAENRTPSSFN